MPHPEIRNREAITPDEADANFGTSHLAGSFWIGALLLDGHWKVSRANYCETISLTSVSCPKS